MANKFDLIYSERCRALRCGAGCGVNATSYRCRCDASRGSLMVGWWYRRLTWLQRQSQCQTTVVKPSILPFHSWRSARTSWWRNHARPTTQRRRRLFQPFRRSATWPARQTSSTASSEMAVRTTSSTSRRIHRTSRCGLKCRAIRNTGQCRAPVRACGGFVSGTDGMCSSSRARRPATGFSSSRATSSASTERWTGGSTRWRCAAVTRSSRRSTRLWERWRKAESWTSYVANGGWRNPSAVDLRVSTSDIVAMQLVAPSLQRHWSPLCLLFSQQQPSLLSSSCASHVLRSTTNKPGSNETDFIHMYINNYRPTSKL